MAKNKTSKKSSSDKFKDKKKNHKTSKSVKKKASQDKKSAVNKDEHTNNSKVKTKSQSKNKDDAAVESKEVSEEGKENKGWNPNIGWALLLIFVGIFALLVNLKLLSFWAVLIFFFRFWPIWLILAGVRLILGRSKMARIFTILITLVTYTTLIIFVLTTQNRGVTNWYNDRPTGFKIPFGTERRTFELKSKEIAVKEGEFEGVSKRNIELKIGASEFEVVDNRQDNYMNFSGTYYDAWGEPGIKADQKGSELDLVFNSKKNSGFSFPLFVPKPGNAPKFIFEIGQEYLSTDLVVDLGAGDGKITLDELNLDKLSTDVGAGRLQVELDDYAVPREEANFNVGAGEVTLQIPKDVGLKVDYTVGAGEFEVDVESGDGFKASGIGKDGVYESENYDSATRKLNVSVIVGAGEMKIDRVE